jgi:hypothetical protein
VYQVRAAAVCRPRGLPGQARWLELVSTRTRLLGRWSFDGAGDGIGRRPVFFLGGRRMAGWNGGLDRTSGTAPRDAWLLLG